MMYWHIGRRRNANATVAITENKFITTLKHVLHYLHQINRSKIDKQSVELPYMFFFFESNIFKFATTSSYIIKTHTIYKSRMYI